MTRRRKTEFENQKRDFDENGQAMRTIRIKRRTRSRVRAMILKEMTNDKEGDDDRASGTRDRSHLFVVSASHQKLIQGVRNL